jgi:hypothetical protein
MKPFRYALSVLFPQGDTEEINPPDWAQGGFFHDEEGG